MPEAPIRDAMNELEEHNEVKLGDAYVVRIPQIQGKIFLREMDEMTTYVFYIYESWYDPDKKQMRNRRSNIGQAIRCMPGAMLPNQNYDRLFDRDTGERIGTKDVEKSRLGRNPYATENETEGTLFGTSFDLENEEEEKTEMTKQQELIRDVLENEGMIRRDSERIREAIRGTERTDGTGKSLHPEPAENETEDSSFSVELGADEISTAGGGSKNETESSAQGCRPFYAENPRSASTEGANGMVHPEPPSIRRRILLDLLTSIREVIKDQARKRPGDVVPAYQVEKINPVLREIREMEEGLGYGEMLELIREPRTHIDAKSGETITEGMTYGDAEILLECYNSVIWFTREEIL